MLKSVDPGALPQETGRRYLILNLSALETSEVEL